MTEGPQRRQAGFTLSELMIVVAIVGVLASVALQSYQRYVMKARWAENTLLVDAIATNAMSCQQETGSSCSGHTGQIQPSDIGYDAWPQGRYVTNLNVAFSPGGNGFHIYFDATPDLGGYHFSRGFSLIKGGTGFIPTQSSQDTVPAAILAAFPVNPSNTVYNY